MIILRLKSARRIVILYVILVLSAGLLPADSAGPGILVSRIKLEGFSGFNTGESNHPSNQMPGYAPFFPVQLDSDPEHEWLVKEWRKNHWPHHKHWCPNSHHAVLYAFDNDGSLLWSWNQGNGVEVGYGYGPVLAYDTDGDGIDEIYARHANDPYNNWPNKIPIEAVAESLVRLDPKTGEELARSAFASPGGQPYDVAARAGIVPVYLDGKTCSIAMIRSYYTGPSHALIMSADLETERMNYSGSPGQGTHCYSAADVDNDGKDEIILGSAVVDDNGTELFNLEFGHPDTAEAADFLPDRPGLEFLNTGSDRHRMMGLIDGSTGEWIWKIDGKTGDSQAAIGDFDLAIPGLEFLTSIFTGKKKEEGSTYLEYGFFEATGKSLNIEDYGLTFSPSFVASISSRAVRWNADGSLAVNGTGLTTATPEQASASIWWAADIRGDWREEYVSCFRGEIILMEAADTLPGDHPTLRSNRKYHQDRSRGPRGFNMSHSMRANPDHNWPLPSTESRSLADRKLKKRE